MNKVYCIPKGGKQLGPEKEADREEVESGVQGEGWKQILLAILAIDRRGISGRQFSPFRCFCQIM